MKDEKLNITSTGFKTPNNYLNDFDDTLMAHLKIENHVDIVKGTGFKAPEGYFESVDDKILSNLKDDTPVISFKRQYYYLAGIAASLILLFGLVFNNSTVTFDDVSTVEIENYINEQGISDDDLALVLTIDDFSEDDFIDYDINDEDVYELLNKEDTELELFIN